MKTKHIKNKNLKNFLLKIYELSTRESTLERFHPKIKAELYE